MLREVLNDEGGEFTAANVRVITPAEPPPLASSWVIIVVAFTTFGGIIGIGHAVLREMTDHRITTVEELRTWTGVDSVIGISKVKRGAWRADDRFPAYLQPAYTKASGFIYDTVAKIAVRLQSGTNRRNGWIICITAPNEGSGVSTIAAHLARIFAESGQRTLLLDSNGRSTPTGRSR